MWRVPRKVTRTREHFIVTGLERDEGVSEVNEEDVKLANAVSLRESAVAEDGAKKRAMVDPLEDYSDLFTGDSSIGTNNLDTEDDKDDARGGGGVEHEAQQAEECDPRKMVGNVNEDNDIDDNLYNYKLWRDIQARRAWSALRITDR